MLNRMCLTINGIVVRVGCWLNRRAKLDWIDDNVAVGSLWDAEKVVTLARKDVDLIIDARLCFTHPSHEQPIVANVIKFADLLCVLSGQGAKTLIHCRAGVDRTPFLAMVYYSKKKGCSYQDAYDYVKLMHPSTVFHWDWVNAPPVKAIT